MCMLKQCLQLEKNFYNHNRLQSRIQTNSKKKQNTKVNCGRQIEKIIIQRKPRPPGRIQKSMRERKPTLFLRQVQNHQSRVLLDSVQVFGCMWKVPGVCEWALSELWSGV